jgi:hypothetical protein
MPLSRANFENWWKSQKRIDAPDGGTQSSALSAIKHGDMAPIVEIL